MYMCAYVYVCLYEYVYVNMYISMSMYMCIQKLYIYISITTCIYVYMCTNSSLLRKNVGDLSKQKDDPRLCAGSCVFCGSQHL